MLALGALLTVLLLQYDSSGATDPTYLVAVTSQAVSGTTESLCAHIHELSTTLSLVVTLSSDNGNVTILKEKSIKRDYYKCVPFQVPVVLADTVGTVHVEIEGASTTLIKTTRILIKPPKKLVFIQTDKPIYKPGETVKFRVVSLDSNFLTHSQKDPNSNRIGQWLNQTTRNGILDLFHRMTPQAAEGNYVITAWDENNQQTTHYFEIKGYVLPKFEVNADLPPIITPSNKEFMLHICAKYNYGKGVQGSVTTEVCGINYDYYWNRGSTPKTCRNYVIKTNKTGCASQVLNVTEYRLSPGGRFQFNYKVEEDGTGITVKGSAGVSYSSDVITVSFVDAPDTYKPGIPYEGKVFSKGSMAQNGRVSVKVQFGTENKGKLSFTLKENAALYSFAQVVVYTVLPNGETVADSWNFPIELCLPNKVFLNFSSSTALPKDTATLNLKARPGSLCSAEGTKQIVTHNDLICLTGDLIGCALKNIADLLRMPYGCGEQKMAILAPNIYILQYLESSGQLTPEILERAKTYLETGYQIELTFKHGDGSYSLHGMRDASGNTWLTAFVMKTFGGAKKYVFIDQTQIDQAKTWLGQQQQTNGCYASVGPFFNNLMRDGVSDHVTLTAYITAALLEMGMNKSDPMVAKGLECLMEASSNLNNMFFTALSFYTYTLAGDQEMRQKLISSLESQAKRNGIERYWSNTPYNGMVGSFEVQMSSYVLLGLLSGPLLPNFGLNYSSTIVRWLVKRQNSYGGFSSTQIAASPGPPDIMIASVVVPSPLILEAAVPEVLSVESALLVVAAALWTLWYYQALAKYNAATYSPTGTVIIRVTSPSKQKYDFTINQQNRLLYQERQLQPPTGNFTLAAQGKGCALVQFSLHYNAPFISSFTFFDLEANAASVCASEKNMLVSLDFTVSYNGPRTGTNMVIIDVKLLSGFVLDDLQSLQQDSRIKLVEQNEGHVILYLDGMKVGEKKSFNMSLQQDVVVKDLKPASVTVYDYYTTYERAVRKYISPCA
ncbi:Alpha-1-macroglobulin [Triplophysa tibetana]|uniref:Alpha-1-macroglobulin n=1 Tax=Triplophysa tibetana TaxID=1572043 RepID=A0A5A9MUX5_9TELE|nr:Alpha-1-macroglobulin [Triplophysa tibetana]